MNYHLHILSHQNLPEKNFRDLIHIVFFGKLRKIGKTGKIVINGDNEQSDIKTPTGELNGLSYAIELSKKIEEIKWIKLNTNHRSDLVGKILDYEHKK